MNKLLVICGPTAMGKTSLGLELAERFNGEIVSADSRQVYKGMDIATGKDLPVNSKQFRNSNFQIGYYLLDGVPVWMLDVAESTESFSVADYYALAFHVVEDILKRAKLPIIVGGTGFYIKVLVDGIDTLNIPPNRELRLAHETKSVDELFNILFHLDPELASNLNPSDRRNKVRLLRKIEIAQLDSVNSVLMNQSIKANETLFIGLTASADLLRGRINERIEGWIRQGAEEEVIKLLAKGVHWDAQSMNAIGYRQWKPYFEGKAKKEEIIEKWKTDEWQYAKRQVTWFKKDSRVRWFDITDPRWGEKVVKEVDRWYNV